MHYPITHTITRYIVDCYFLLIVIEKFFGRYIYSKILFVIVLLLSLLSVNGEYYSYAGDRKSKTENRIRITGDFRSIINYSESDSRDGSSSVSDEFGLRLRIRAEYWLTENAKIGSRVAGICYYDDCNLDWYWGTAGSTNNGLAKGQATLDELYLNLMPSNRSSLTFGRMQTRNILGGVVFSKSLDRNDGHNTRVTWTDGIRAAYKASNGWNGEFIMQYNGPDGPGSIRRGDLDFNHSDARWTYFVGFENLQKKGPIIQRAISISYLPSSLLKDGNANGRREDYWGLVGRLMLSFPILQGNTRFLTGAEIGYAPNTPTSGAVGITSNPSGMAWNIVGSVVDFIPGHSFGINYARTGAGWLLSPQYRDNDELIELRYRWEIDSNNVFDARVRRRKDIEYKLGSARKNSEYDFFARFTRKFSVLD